MPRIFLLFILFSISAISEENNDIPIEDFSQKITDFQHALSPNGKYLAYIKSYPTMHALNITDIEKKTSYMKLTFHTSTPENLFG